MDTAKKSSRGTTLAGSKTKSWGGSADCNCVDNPPGAGSAGVCDESEAGWVLQQLFVPPQQHFFGAAQPADAGRHDAVTPCVKTSAKLNRRAKAAFIVLKMHRITPMHQSFPAI
jgi:hypothetical protein